MFAFLRNKTVNGRVYQVIQESYREDGKVKSRIVEYLGPVDPKYNTKQQKKGAGRGQAAITATTTRTRSASTAATASGSCSSDSSAHHSTTSSPAPDSMKSSPEIGTTPSSRDIGTTSAMVHRSFARQGCVLNPKVTADTPSLLHKRLNLGDRRVSRSRLDAESRQFVAVLQSKGVAPKGVIKIKWGERLSSKVKRNNVVVYSPHKVSPARLRIEIHKAHARLALKSLKRDRPEEYQNLALQAETSFAISKQMISHVLKLGKDWRKGWKNIGLHFGNYANLKRNFRDPTQWGFFDYDRKQSWEDEMVSIYAQAASHGNLFRYGKALYQEQQRAGAVLASLESRMADPSTRRGSREALAVDLDRASTRFAILTEGRRKLRTLNALFYSNYAFFSPSYRDSQKK